MRYAVEIARSVYRRTEGHSEGRGLDQAIEAARQAAEHAGADSVEVVRGDAFVARSGPWGSTSSATASADRGT